MRAQDMIKEIRGNDYSTIAVSAIIPGVGRFNFDARPVDVNIEGNKLYVGTEDQGMCLDDVDSFVLTKDEFEEDYVLYNKESGADIMVSIA